MSILPPFLPKSPLETAIETIGRVVTIGIAVFTGKTLIDEFQKKEIVKYMEELKELKEKGLISEIEFEDRKKEALDKNAKKC